MENVITGIILGICLSISLIRVILLDIAWLKMMKTRLCLVRIMKNGEINTMCCGLNGGTVLYSTNSYPLHPAGASKMHTAAISLTPTCRSQGFIFPGPQRFNAFCGDQPSPPSKNGRYMLWCVPATSYVPGGLI